MRPLLARLQFVHAVLIVSLVPLAGMLLALVLYFGDLLGQAGQAATAVELVELVESASDLAQQGAVERGLSAGYIGSNGQRFAKELAEQRQKMDAAVTKIRAWPLAELGQESRDRVRLILDQLDELPRVRQRVDDLVPNSGAFGYFSSLNDKALTFSSTLSRNLTRVPELKNLLDATLTLFWATEESGRVRGLLNGAFARGQLDEGNYYVVVQAITSSDIYLTQFQHLAPVDFAERLEALRAKDYWQQVEGIQQQLLRQGEGGSLADPSQGRWFALATERIGAIKGLAQELNLLLRDRAHATQGDARAALFWSGLASLALICPLIYLIWVLTRSLKHRVHVVDHTLRAITQDSDLTLRLNDDSGDELGNISRSVDQHLDEVAGIFKGFHVTARSATEVMDNIMQAAGAATGNADSQHQRAEQLAHAMQEIAQAAAEVSGSMQLARDSMNQAGEHVERSQHLTESVNQGFQELTHSIADNRAEIERLDQHSGEISGILDTITGIAEQTNLLALNPAIEAARAGEQGRGFAVVADEVRSLAYKTRESTESVRTMIERLQNSSASALAAMERNEEQVLQTASRVRDSAEAVALVTREIERVQDLVSQVAAAAEQQSATLAEVQLTTSGINNLSEDTVLRVKTVNDAARHLREQLSTLEQRLSGFRMA
ncbi:methyl-accepting chemotaxis protein [Gallaecimonas xiamenensis]|nr:methyl-accepting chemotaxis protein [Gallaecimonas xiamenensis]